MEATSVRPDAVESATQPRGKAARFSLGLGRVPLIIVCGLVLSGAAIVVAGGFLPSNHLYLQSTALEIGAALLLAAPLILVERLMNERFKTVETEVQSVADDVQTVAANVQRTQTRLDELGEETRSRIAAARQSDAELVNKLRTDATEQNVWNALHRAQELGALDRGGVRVQIPGSSLRVRFNASPGDSETTGSVEISVEDRNGRPVSGYESWSADEETGAALTALVEDLWRRKEYPGDDRFDATKIFETLANTLSAVISASTHGRKGGSLGPVVELVEPWALTCNGLEHIHDASRNAHKRLLLDNRDRARTALAAGDDGDVLLDDVIATSAMYHAGVAQRRADQRMRRTR